MFVYRVPFTSLRLGAPLGSGATGDVFEGQLGAAPVAVKRLKLASIPNARAELSRRFRAEVDVLSRYAHPRLVRLLAWAEEEDAAAPHPFAIVLELMEEGSLGDWLRGAGGEPAKRGPPLSPLERLDIALGAAAGLAFLHGQAEEGEGGGAAGGGPVLHRDVKPSNIGLTRVGGSGALFAKLLDCGLAKALSPPPQEGGTARVDNTHSKAVAGTPAYMAPELSGGATVLTEVFAFGCVLLELLTGRALRDREAMEWEKEARRKGGGAASLAARADTAAWPPPAAAALAEVALACTAVDEEDRPQGMGAVVARLRALRPLVAVAPPPLKECLVCFEAVAEAAGVRCGGGEAHFACVGCFNDHARAHLTPTKLQASEGRVQCVEAACEHKWSLELAAEPLDKATTRAWAIALRVLAIDAPKEKAAREAALAAREAAAKRAASFAAKVSALRLVIVDRDLNLRCPKCALVFVDYNGCNALVCPNCACGFCAACLKDCGADAHPHIRGSAVCGPEYFNKPLFERERRARFLARVVAAVAGLAGEPEGAPLQRAVVAELVKADFEGVGFGEAEVLAGAGVKEGGEAGAQGGEEVGAPPPPPPPPGGGWACPICTLANAGGAERCGACGHVPEARQPIALNGVPLPLRGHCVAALNHGSEVSVLAVVEGVGLISGSNTATVACIRTWAQAADGGLQATSQMAARAAGIAPLPGGQFVIARGATSFVEVWNAATRTRTHQLQGHTAIVSCVAALPYGLFASGNKSVRIWNAAAGVQRANLKGHADRVHALAALPDGRLASGSADRTIRLWNLEARACVQVLQHPSSVRALAVIDGGRRLASGCEDHRIHIWPLAAPAGRVAEAPLEGHTDSVFSLTALPNGLLASGSGDKTVRVWDVGARACVAVMGGHAGSVHALAALPDGRLASGAVFEPTIRVWALTAPGSPEDAAAAAEAARGGVMAPAVDAAIVQRAAAALARRGAVAAAGGGGGGGAGAGRFLQAHCVAMLNHGVAGVRALAVIEGAGLMSGGPDHIRAWAHGAGEGLRMIVGRAFGIAALPGGRFATVGGDTQLVDVWDAGNGQRLRTLRDHTSSAVCVASLPGGLLAIGGQFKAVRIWDAAAAASVATLEGHTECVNVLAALPGGRLASGSADWTVRIWSVETCGCVRVLQHAGSLSALAVLDGDRLASACDDKSVHVWSILEGGVKKALLEGHTSPVRSLAALPNGLLASGSGDKMVCVWNVGARACLAVLKGHVGPVTALVALPDGRLASGSEEEPLIRVWALTAPGSPENAAAAEKAAHLDARWEAVRVFCDNQALLNTKGYTLAEGVRDIDTDMCFCCSANFFWALRRHHCRQCGQVVCGACSKGRKELRFARKEPGEGDYPDTVRVCLRCFGAPPRNISRFILPLRHYNDAADNHYPPTPAAPLP